MFKKKVQSTYSKYLNKLQLSQNFIETQISLDKLKADLIFFKPEAYFQLIKFIKNSTIKYVY